MIELRDMMTPEQVAAYLQVNAETVYRYIRHGKLAAVRLGRHYRIPDDSLKQFLRANRTDLAAPAHEVTIPRNQGDREARKQARREALAQATALRAVLRDDMGGKSFPSVVDLLREAREDELS